MQQCGFADDTHAQRIWVAKFGVTVPSKASPGTGRGPPNTKTSIVMCMSFKQSGQKSAAVAAYAHFCPRTPTTAGKQELFTACMGDAADRGQLLGAPAPPCSTCSAGVRDVKDTGKSCPICFHRMQASGCSFALAASILCTPHWCHAMLTSGSPTDGAGTWCKHILGCL